MSSSPSPSADPSTPSDSAGGRQSETGGSSPAVYRTKPNRHFPFLARHPWVLANTLADAPKQTSKKTASAKTGSPDSDPPGGQHQDAQAASEPVHADPEHAKQQQTEPRDPGQPIDLLDHDGNWIGRGLANPASRLRLRLYSFSRDEPVDDALFAKRIDEAVARRRLATPANPPAGAAAAEDGTAENAQMPIGLPQKGERLIFSEADRLSGLIVDRYADCLSVQFTAAALLSRGPFLIDEVLAAAEKYGTPCRRVVARMDAATAKHEAVSPEQIAEVESWSRGIDTAPSPTNLSAPNPSDPSSSDAEQDPESSNHTVWYWHNDLKMAIDLRDGQKTGGYLDQQANHAEAARYMKGKRVLDICTYTGGFALAAARAGASEVIGVDSSEKALQMARRNADANSLSHVQFERADCFDDLKQRHERGEFFDAVVLDPPRFAGSRRQVDSALRAYARLNMSAVNLLQPGGLLVTCSCSGHVSRADFLNMLADVGRKRRRDIIILQSRGPASDHPLAVSCPESDYLKCVIAQVH
ncbi:class I SAM-dependent rRNA methyltransferase [Rhodopirellula sallentina]|uniref:SAM-dependent methyltransferase n=1 Tax=Rhodopirellula sallentina SM41 TaxID=1263870 RepID=M5UJA1_9BACT|nr:class I SAM-dependent rRNA methyltransferase [Rhodopirellula sallentina]EMI56098.1 SAM-dependent methyltransferase [Rhodopirellula sallentina SM41]